MFIKLLILAALGYLAYRAARTVFQPRDTARPAGRRISSGRVDDVMVRDPFCGVYFPKREGVTAKVDGETLIFCSEDCRDRYLQGRC